MPSTIAPTGTALAGVIASAPWTLDGWSIPDYGSVPFYPRYEVDVLQPRNLDGARYRLGGAHYPTFRMRTITGVSGFAAARSVARDMEVVTGDYVSVTLVVGDATETHTCVVLTCSAVANAKRVIGAVFSGGSSSASVDALWTMQRVQV